MARVDVFRKKNKNSKWEFYAVPIYPHQVATMQVPPIRAVVAYKPDAEWTLLDDSFEFLWSLNAMSYVEITKSNGEFIEGYFRGLHRGTGAANVSVHFTLGKEGASDGIGVKTLSDFKKFTVDRLGRKFEVKREVRTWRGKACI
jgi:CRISPR-associated endonuclease Csn1